MRRRLTVHRSVVGMSVHWMWGREWEISMNIFVGLHESSQTGETCVERRLRSELTWIITIIMVLLNNIEVVELPTTWRNQLSSANDRMQIWRNFKKWTLNQRSKHETMDEIDSDCDQTPRENTISFCPWLINCNNVDCKYLLWFGNNIEIIKEDCTNKCWWMKRWQTAEHRSRRWWRWRRCVLASDDSALIVMPVGAEQNEVFLIWIRLMVTRILNVIIWRRGLLLLVGGWVSQWLDVGWYGTNVMSGQEGMGTYCGFVN